jgi:hypothetical protein
MKGDATIWLVVGTTALRLLWPPARAIAGWSATLLLYLIVALRQSGGSDAANAALFVPRKAA